MLDLKIAHAAPVYQLPCTALQLCPLSRFRYAKWQFCIKMRQISCADARGAAASDDSTTPVASKIIPTMTADPLTYLESSNSNHDSYIESIGVSVMEPGISDQNKSEENGQPPTETAEPNLEDRLVGICGRITSLFPLWVILAAGAALWRSELFTWSVRLMVYRPFASRTPLLVAQSWKKSQNVILHHVVYISHSIRLRACHLQHSRML